MAEVDTSFYKDAVSENPLDMAGKVVDYRNKLLNNQQQQQAVQANSIKLATERFGMINNAASGLLSDPDLGKKDLTGKLWDTLGRLTKGDAMSAQHAVQFMQQFPTDPQQQVQAVKNVHAQTLDAWQKGQAYLGQTTPLSTGGGTKFVQTPAFSGAPPQERGYVANTVPPTTPVTDPATLKQTYAGGSGNPGIQPPAAPAAPGGSPPQPLLAAPAPGEAAAKERTGTGSGTMLSDERARASNYRREVYPLEQAIPALERLGKTGTGPGTEQINQIKSFLQSAGVPGVDVNKIKDYDEAHKYLTDWVTANGDHSTNDKLAAAFSSNASTKISNAAAVDVTKAALALRRMKQAQLEQFEASGLPESQYGKWAAKWNREQDPRIYGWDNMNDSQRKTFLQSVTGPKRDLLIMQLHHAADAGFVDPQSLVPSKK